MAGISTQTSRFSVLHIESDDEEKKPSPKSTSNPNTAEKQTNKSNSKCNKKKNKNSESETQQLRHMAFTNGSGGNKNKKKKNKAGQKAEKAESEQWEQWKKLDSTHVQESYEQDLQKALLESQVQYEMEKKENLNGDNARNGNEDQKKRRKKKEKPQAMSLGEFSKVAEAESVAQQSDEELPGDTLAAPKLKSKPLQEKDEHFFERVDAGVDKILNQEKIHAEYTKKYALQSVQTLKHEEEISRKDKEITFLRATNKKLQEKLTHVKERNQVVCQLLADGEMKSKAQILKELNDTKKVQQELTETVQTLSSDLEKERSLVHTLRTELEKYKDKNVKHPKA